MASMNNDLTFLAVHAHPDDESFGTGGILAKHSTEGIKTVVVYATRGEAGQIQNPDFVPRSPNLDMKEIRSLELQEALKVLRVGSVHFLEYRDSGMDGSPDNLNPRSFFQADQDEAAARLVRILRRTRPHVVVTYNEKGIYGHPDHIMANKVTRRAFHASGDPDYHDKDGAEPWKPTKLYYTALPKNRLIKMQEMARAKGEDPGFDPDFLGTPEDQITTTVDVRKFLPFKIKALNCHRSQIGPQSFFRRMPEEWREEAMGYEHFVLVNGHVESAEKEMDLFKGLR